MKNTTTVNGREYDVLGSWVKVRITVLDASSPKEKVEFVQYGNITDYGIGDSWEAVLPPSANIGTKNGELIPGAIV